MRILHVESSILGDHSVSRRLTGELVAQMAEVYPHAQITQLDLAKTPPPIFGQKDLGKRSPYLEQFLAADYVVIGAPMYNLSVPSSLRAWLDYLVLRDVTFEDLADGRTRGLLSGKTIVVVSTRGAVVPPEQDFQEAYLRAAFAFIGFERIEVLRAEGLAVPALQDVGVAAVRRQGAMLVQRLLASVQ